MNDGAEVTLDAALAQLAETEFDLPQKELLWLRENWADCRAPLLDLFRAFLSGEDRSRKTTESLIYTTYMMAEKREVEAFPLFCEMGALDRDLIDEAMGEDWSTATFPRMLTSTYNGDVDPLKRLIENPKADEYTRNSAIEAFWYLVFTGRIDREAARAYLGDLFETLQPRDTHFIWSGWAIAIGRLGFEDHREIVKIAFDREYIEPIVTDYDQFEKDLADAVAGGEEARKYGETYYAPVEDMVEDLSTWYCFSEKRKLDEKKRAARNTLDARRHRPAPPPPKNKVGRNDPCPCGSGKKYKKCCLRAA